MPNFIRISGTGTYDADSACCGQTKEVMRLRLNFADLRELLDIGLSKAGESAGNAASEAVGANKHESARAPDRQLPMRTLAELRSGDYGRVVAVRGEPYLAIRILELGLVGGTPFRVLRTAPLGGPIELELEGALLSLRRSEASAVQVEM